MAATANIVINQATRAAGVAGESRTDGVVSQLVTLTNNDDTDVSTWSWELVGKPPGSTAVLAGAATATATFTPDLVGTYGIKLSVNGTSSVMTRGLGVGTEKVKARVPFAGETTEFDPTTGWWQSQKDLIDNVEAISPYNAKVYGYDNRGGGVGLTHEGTLQEVLDKVGSDPASVALASGTWRIQADKTLPATLGLKMQPGAVLSIDGGKTLTLNSWIDGHAFHQIFDGAGTLAGKLSGPVVHPEWWGAKGDADPATPGSGTDDSIAVQACLKYASDNDCVVDLGTRWYNCGATNIYFYGGCSIVGAGKGRCGLVLGTDLSVSVGAGFELGFINIGITEIPTILNGTDLSPVDPWNGALKGFTVLVRAAAAPNDTLARHTFLIHNAYRWIMEDIDVDQMSIPMTTQCCAFASLDTSATWATVAQCKYGIVERCDFRMAGTADAGTPGYNGPSAVNMIKANHVYFGRCYVTGSSDDGMMFISCNNCHAHQNYIQTTHGRLGTLVSYDCSFVDNWIERQFGADSTWFSGSLLGCHEDASAGTPSTGNKFIGNTVYVPDGPTSTVTMLIFEGCRNFEAIGNILKSDCSTATVNAIKIATFNKGLGWDDPTNLDDTNIGGTKYSKPRNGLVSGNRATGSYPGGLTESALTGTQLVGPIHYSDNEMASYNIFGDNSTFDASNRIVNTRTTYPAAAVLGGSEYRYLAGDAASNPFCIGEWIIPQVRVGQTITGYLTGGGTTKYMFGEGVVLYVEADASAAPTGANITVKLKKGGAQVIGDITVSSGNAYGYLDARTYSDRHYRYTNYFEVTATGEAGMTNIVDLTVRVYAMRARPV